MPQRRPWPLWVQVTLGIVVAFVLIVFIAPFLLGFCRVLLFGS